MAKKTIYRDSDSGRIISQTQSTQRDPRTWEKERVTVKK